MKETLFLGVTAMHTSNQDN